MVGFVWYILLITATLIGLNIIIDYKRYGKRIFDCFKKKDNRFSMKSLLINILKNEIRDKLLFIERNDNYFIVITKFDIFLIQLINENGNIYGSINDEFFKIEKGNIKELKNPLPQFIKEIRLLLNDKFEIKPLIVKTNKDCSLNLSGFDKRNILSLENFSYLLYKLQHSTSKYSEKDMELMYERLKVLLDGNN